eukprot:CAMPEP_0197663976 /NCGR_PEP_ID=MMETSP1338-20131121/58348_1 /TAXON_ID=43686 ORGANISM="Pelagodinium beii, Strain RCC1491" /NCGR_SAMPLE_ID=MMETSP1338 /ASSEMBLY_ACC=CAM_ASM_000754 /LENGTH=1775 /DNA_ID=CAMNT_0043242517 /DNA_START=13 /DNA_END=5340 /DNA_ORIENTATION=-
MAPPKKPAQASKVDLHASHVPLSAPINFVGPRTVCYAVANQVCIWDLDADSKTYLPTTAYGITKLCTNVELGLVAFSVGGSFPQVLVYQLKPQKLMFTISDVAELELADLAFSRCGSRLYALARATSKKMCVFSMKTGERLKGCDLELPLRFDKISVYPGHKDHMAVVRGSSVRIIEVTKSFETYITKLQPNSIPVDADISISAFSWTAAGHFIVATRQGLVCTLDGSSGALLHVCQAESPITSISMTRSHLVTSHIGNALNFWSFRPEQLTESPEAFSFASGLADAPSMASAASGGVFKLEKTADLENVGQAKAHGLLGQVACVQVTPDFQNGIVTTAEGEVWSLNLPPQQNQDPLAGRSGEGEEEDMYVRGDQLDMQMLTWFHTHAITDICNLDNDVKVCASADEGGRLRIWEAVRDKDPKGFRMMRFTSCVTSLACDSDGKLLMAGTDSGCIHLLSVSPWTQARVVDTQRISEVGIVKICCCISEDGMSLKVAALLFNNAIAFCNVSLREPKVKMLGFIEPLGAIEDICFHDKDINPEDTVPAKLLVVGTAGEASCLWAVRSPREDYEPHSLEIERDACPVASAKLADKRPDEKPTAVGSQSRKAVVVGFANGAVRSYTPPSSTDKMSKQAVATPLASLVKPDDTQLVSSLRPSTTGAALAVASMDGSVCQIGIGFDETATETVSKTLHNPFNGGATQVISGKDGQVVVSTGGSDGLLVWSAPDSGIRLQPADAEPDEDMFNEETQGGFFELDDTDMTAFPVWVPVDRSPLDGAEEAEEVDQELELSEEALAKRRMMTHEVDQLRKKLRVLIEHNNAAQDLEKLERNEFCVDFEERDAIAAKSKEGCDALRAKIEHENMARQLVRDRLIKEFWDPMREKGCQIASLMSNISVSSYPERIVSEEESTVTKKLHVLRNSEKLEWQMLRGPECPAELRSDLVLEEDSFATGRERYIVNWWPAAGTKAAESRAKQLADAEAEEKRIAQIAKEKAEKEAEKAKDSKDSKDKDKGGGDAKKEDAGGKAGAGEMERGSTVDAIVTMEQDFLYEPFELVTNSRRRLQINLLQSLSAEYRAHFNELFKACQSDKANIMDGIKEKTTRIKAILGELQIDEHVPEPKLQNVEEADSVLKVKDDEIVAEKFISAEEKKKLAEAAAKEEERLRQLRENDAGQRALVQMMGGTLKTKKDLSALEITLDKEPWMDEIPEEDMTEVQKAAYAEYLANEKALMELQDAYRKQLHEELKTLRAGVEDLTVQFEALLKKLHHERFAHDAKFFCQELYCARLQLALLQSVEDSMVKEQAQLDVEAAAGKVKTAESKLAAFSEEVAEAKGQQDDRVRYEKEVSSAQHFRQAFANSALEPNAITALLQLFRKRRDKAAAGAAPHMRASASGSQLLKAGTGLPPYNPFNAAAAGDPYLDLGVPEPKGTSPDAPADDDPKLEDCPEGVDEASFQQMMQLRSEKLAAEAEVAKGAAVLTEMAGLQTHLQKETEEAKVNYDRLERELREHKDLMNRELYDIELLFKLKQGQVEVPQAAVVTDYSDAIVIDQEVVESRNGRITELGKSKVNVLTIIKEFRKKLSLLEWEHSMLAMQTTDLEERTKDVHMLRVTKDLQSLLKGGEEGRNKAESDLLERKIEHLNETTEKKEQALKKQYGIGSHAAKLRKGENLMLEKKLRELQQNVIQREHIRRLRAPAGGGAKPQTGGGGRVEENEGAAKAAQSAFREVRGRQKLMEAAKKHTQEIELLHKELDRLRQRTFPSFVQLHEDRPANPDHTG